MFLRRNSRGVDLSKPLSVKDFMKHDVVTFKADTNVLEAIRILLENKISGAPVVDDSGWIVGMISEYDCLKPNLISSYHNDMGTLVKDCMTTEIVTIKSHISLTEAAGLFIEKGLRRLPVVENKRLIGQISRRDILEAINKSLNSNNN
jgi:CBS domain-containing protein